MCTVSKAPQHPPPPSHRKIRLVSQSQARAFADFARLARHTLSCTQAMERSTLADIEAVHGCAGCRAELEQRGRADTVCQAWSDETEMLKRPRLFRVQL